MSRSHGDFALQKLLLLCDQAGLVVLHSCCHLGPFCCYLSLCDLLPCRLPLLGCGIVHELVGCNTLARANMLLFGHCAFHNCIYG